MKGRRGTSETDPAKREVRDAEVRRLAFDEGLNPAQVASVIGTITDTRVSQILGLGPLRVQIVDFLEQNPVGGYSVRDISAALHADINKVQYMVDALKKRGVVTADIGGGAEFGDHKAFTNIRLKYRHPVLKHRPPPPIQVAPPIEPDNGIDQEADELDTAEVVATPDLSVQEIPVYPLLYGLLERDVRIGEAAKLLESVGLDDLALQALQRQDDFTPMEREYMKFARQHHAT